jgi:glutamate carboxypeptidase
VFEVVDILWPIAGSFGVDQIAQTEEVHIKPSRLSVTRRAHAAGKSSPFITVIMSIRTGSVPILSTSIAGLRKSWGVLPKAWPDSRKTPDCFTGGCRRGCNVATTLDGLLPFLMPIDSRAAVMEKRLVRWVEINSGTSHRVGLERMAGELETAFREWCPCAPERLELSNGPALRWICRSEASRRVFLGGHFDTVYPLDHSFQSCTYLDNNTLRGPGVADMKGGILVLLEALRAFEASPFASTVGWEVLLSPDEEIGSIHSLPLLEMAAKRCAIGLLFEPALQGRGDLVRRRPGSGVFCLKAKGRPAHVGRDFAAGRSAIVALCEAVQRIHALNRRGDMIANTGAIQGGGPVNVVPAEARAYLNVRSEKPDAAEQALRRILAEVQIEHEVELSLEGHFTRPPKPLTSDLEALFVRFRSCAKTLGLSLDWRDTGGCCDGNNLAANGLPNLDTLGVRGGNTHSPDEFVHLDSLVERAKLSALFLMDWAAHASYEKASVP